MKFTAFIIFFLTLIAKTCSAGLSVNTSNLDESLVEASIEILESCYTDRFSTVGIAGPSAESIIERISSRKTVISTTLIDGSSRVVLHDPVTLETRYKLQVFVVTVTDPNILVKTLGQIKNSTWWNHMGSFLLIDLVRTENGCSNAYEILWTAWKMNLLKTNFMCLHQTRGRLIYTFNPYTGKAPGPWQQENTYEGINGHIWTLFARKYNENESRCDNLDFDKTGDLGGYEIRATVEDMEAWWYADSTKKPTIDDRVLNVTAQLLMDSLNATWKLSLYPEFELQLRDENGTRIGPENEVENGTSDIFLVILGATPSEINGKTYPLYRSELAVITQYRGDMSQLEKLISVLDMISRIGVLVVLMITLMFFKFCLRKPLTPALLDLMLIICNAGLQTIPYKLAPRLYLTGLFIFVVTIQGIYSGKLASLLTKKVRLPDVNSYEDLARSDHKIYGLGSWIQFFDLPAFKGRCKVLRTLYCTQYVERDPKIACAGSKIAYITQAARKKMHLSREPMGGIWGAYMIRLDWPLQDRVNRIYEHLAAGGIQDLLYARESRIEMRTLESYELQDQEPELKVLTMEHLGFAFVILAIGLGFATVTFIIEVVIFRRANARPQKRIRRRVRLMEYFKERRLFGGN